MACMKLGSKADAFQREGQAWFCVTGLPSDVAVEVGEMSFHLHKFPLLSRSGVLERLIAETSDNGEEGCVVHLANIPGAAKTFELVAKFCYGVKLELTSSNVVHLRCAAEQLEMTEEYGDDNLIAETELFLNEIVLLSWKDSLKALQTCEDVLLQADDLHIVSRCIDSLSTKASSDPNLFGWPMIEESCPKQSSSGSVLWNGINTGTKPSNLKSDWWYEDVSVLSLPLYKRLISAMESRGNSHEIISGSLTSYAKRYLPGLSRCRVVNESNTAIAPVAITTSLSEDEQKLLLEEIDNLLPMQKGNTSTKFLFGMLRTAMILHASSSCISNLERRIGMQLDQATLEDLLMPTFSYSMETLYNVDCVQRILNQFLAVDQATGEASLLSAEDDHAISSPSLTPITRVAKLIDGYLAEVSSDINLKLLKFLSLAGAIPDYARPLDDGLYRAIDIYLKAHPRLADFEKEQLCRLMDCQKLSLEACTHAAQNERLPLRVVVQVLFFEQLQLRTSVAGCFLVSENLDASRQLRSGFVGSNEGGGLTTAVKDNQVLKLGMDNMRMRVFELEKECTDMKQEIKKFSTGKTGHAWSNLSKMFGFKIKSQLCSAGEGSVSNQHKDESLKTEKMRRHKNLTKYE